MPQNLITLFWKGFFAEKALKIILKWLKYGMLEIPKSAEPTAKPQGVKAGKDCFYFFYQFMWHNLGNLAPYNSIPWVQDHNSVWEMMKSLRMMSRHSQWAPREGEMLVNKNMKSQCFPSLHLGASAQKDQRFMFFRHWTLDTDPKTVRDSQI